MATHNKAVKNKVVVVGSSMAVMAGVVLMVNMGELNVTTLLFVIVRILGTACSSCTIYTSS